MKRILVMIAFAACSEHLADRVRQADDRRLADKPWTPGLHEQR